jgi:hypothetical protein
VKLRLARANGTAKHLGNVLVLISFNVMQHENDATAGGEDFLQHVPDLPGQWSQ